MSTGTEDTNDYGFDPDAGGVDDLTDAEWAHLVSDAYMDEAGDLDNGDGLTDAEAYVTYSSVVGKHGSPQEQAFRNMLGR